MCKCHGRFDVGFSSGICKPCGGAADLEGGECGEWNVALELHQRRGYTSGRVGDFTLLCTNRMEQVNESAGGMLAHSVRSARMGSTREAFQAGNRHARAATTSSVAATAR